MDIIEKLKERFPECVWENVSLEPDICLKIAPDKLKDVAYYLKTEPTLDFDFLMCLSGIDRGDKLEVVYHLFSSENKKALVLKVETDKKEPSVPSVEDVWKTANWHEREAYDLLGISFAGHPDLRRILLPEDWEGFPLRKDYQPPKEYRGIDLTP